MVINLTKMVQLPGNFQSETSNHRVVKTFTMMRRGGGEKPERRLGRVMLAQALSSHVSVDSLYLDGLDSRVDEDVSVPQSSLVGLPLEDNPIESQVPQTVNSELNSEDLSLTGDEEHNWCLTYTIIAAVFISVCLGSCFGSQCKRCCGEKPRAEQKEPIVEESVNEALPRLSTRLSYASLGDQKNEIPFVNQLLFPVTVDTYNELDIQPNMICWIPDSMSTRGIPVLVIRPEDEIVPQPRPVVRPEDEIVPQPRPVVRPEDEIVPQPRPTSCYTVVYFHGNSDTAGSKGNLQMMRNLVEQTGCTVVVMEYPGYGILPKEPHANPKNVTNWTLCLYDWLKYDLNLDMSFVIPLGRSIGSGPASVLAAVMAKDSEKKENVGEPPVPLGLALSSAFTSAADVLLDKVTRGGGGLQRELTRLVMGGTFNNEAMLRHLEGTHLSVSHGEKDLIIPVQHAKQLVDGYKFGKTKTIYADADHNSITHEQLAQPVDNMIKLLGNKFGKFEENAGKKRIEAFGRTQTDRGISGAFRSDSSLHEASDTPAVPAVDA